MAHSRQDVIRIRERYLAASQASIDATKELINMLGAQLRAEENARRAVNMIMGEEQMAQPIYHIRPDGTPVPLDLNNVAQEEE